MSKHGEPWSVVETLSLEVWDDAGEPLADVIDPGPADRIVDCVNACSGVEFHGETHEAVKEAVKVLHALTNQVVITRDSGIDLLAVYVSPRYYEGMKKLCKRFVVLEEGWPYNNE